MVEVDFFDCDHTPVDRLTYAVIAGRHRGKWIFIRHRRRGSFEIPGGHIEEGESAEDAAGRELAEETGSLKFTLHCVATYSVRREDSTGFGRLFFAEVDEIGSIPDDDEVEEVLLLDRLPDRLTYPEIQPRLFERVIRYIQGLPS